jgi:hypothetical protein
MSRTTLPMVGGCRCGKVRFAVTAPPLLTMACHCTGCQRMTASAYSISIAVPEDSFTVTAGETVIGGPHGAQLHHHHCDWCKSWLFTRIEPDIGFVNVRASMLDTPGWFMPFIETFTSEAFPWAKTGATHSYAQFPAIEEYQPLIEAFARSGG